MIQTATVFIPAYGLFLKKKKKQKQYLYQKGKYSDSKISTPKYTKSYGVVA
jgi:hypothetical protein